jgi:hypothetical protein
MSIDSLVRVVRRFCATRGMGSVVDRDAVARMIRTAYEIGVAEGERLARIERNEQESITHAEEG